ncbi:beta-ketoacyl synthase chain length factor [Shewanella intestini]|uniref:Beta-ketoacyl synthase chain length factor n=1 Tax=Shewanella intestini TaxID=2017544 RepID=A0ABS5I2Q8_9GAMM|nr:MULTISPECIES: beta-ketoacyl synthase chain length factor [Shewanella]MBR9728312.1 beta-ketoacyl synthase chain length factor [Shewanella intestini]MRG35777.1 hypothetical protein [Shewanella sp. XMDDZSB0408]
MQVNCQLRAWSATSDNLTALSGHPISVNEYKIPSAIKRRASALTKLVIGTCLPILSETDIDYIVFATQHGEINRTLTLLNSLAQEQELSPTAFAQSVTSTAPGLLTIAAKKPIPFTTVSGNNNTLEAGLIEVAIRLQQQPQHQILLIVADESLPEIYKQHNPNQHQANLLAMHFAPGQQWQISISAAAQLDDDSNTANNTVHPANETKQRQQFIDQLANQLSFKVRFNNSTQWTWVKQ